MKSGRKLNELRELREFHASRASYAKLPCDGRAGPNTTPHPVNVHRQPARNLPCVLASAKADSAHLTPKPFLPMSLQPSNAFSAFLTQRLQARWVVLLPSSAVARSLQHQLRHLRHLHAAATTIKLSSPSDMDQLSHLHPLAKSRGSAEVAGAAKCRRSLLLSEGLP